MTGPLWYAPVAVASIAVASTVPWDAWWAGGDLAIYLEGARGLFEGDAYSGKMIHAPVFALAISPLTLVPFDLALLLWRVAELAALAWVLRGAGPLAALAFVMPWLWWAELMLGNVMGFATAAMIAVIRWPSVRTVTLYAVLVAVIPKPAFLPVLIYGFVAVPQARRRIIAIGAIGVAMLAWPGYLPAMLMQTELLRAPSWPEPWAKIAAVSFTMAGFRHPRLLGIASLFANPYLWLYYLTPLATLLVPPGRRKPRTEVGSRAPGS